MSHVQSWLRQVSTTLLSGAILISNGCGGSTDEGSPDVPPSSPVSFAQQAYVKASNTESGPSFGFRVALSSNTLAVGAFEGSCATGINGDQANRGCPGAGAAYIFTRTNDVWSQQAYIKASNTEAKDTFLEVALSGDTLAVGAYLEDSCASGVNGDQTNNSCENAGTVYVYTRTNGVWSQQAYLKASNPDARDFFGTSVAIDGDTLVVGVGSEDSCARGLNGDQLSNGCFDSGAVYVFTRTNDVWSQQAYIKASNTKADEQFGTTVALSGDMLAVGAPREDSCATGLNGDQTNNGCNAAGAVYVFTRTNGVWSQRDYVKASNSGMNDNFGFVTLSGNTLAVGAQEEESCATGLNGDQANNDCSFAGAVYVYREK